MYAHSIKNPHIIHYVRGGRYICQQACGTTESKSTRSWGEVTCKNCLHLCPPEIKKVLDARGVE